MKQCNYYIEQGYCTQVRRPGPAQSTARAQRPGLSAVPVSARHSRQGDLCTFAHGEHEIGMPLDDDQVRAPSHLGDDPSGRQGRGSAQLRMHASGTVLPSSPLTGRAFSR
jgi:hypothetical protein